MLYVSPDGNDRWNGQLARPNAAKTDGPLQTLEAARDKLRSIKLRVKRSPSNPPQPDRIIIGSGTYEMSAPFVLSPQHSGSAEFPISYEAAPNAKPVFSGARVLAGWQRGADGIWETQIPDVAARKWYFEQLWVNGKRATRARTPNDFYLYAAGKARLENVAVPIDPQAINTRAFRAQPQDIAPLLSLSPRELNDVTATIFQSWETARLRLAGIEPKSGTITTTGATLWGFFAYAPHQRYALENFKAALDAPGEWFLDRARGTLFYKPLPGEEMTKARVLAPVAESFIQIQGDAAAGNLVTDISFKGLAFRHAQYVLPPEGHSAGQAEVDIPAVVMADGAQNISFENCEISHIGTYAIWFRNGCKNNSVRHCLLSDLGAGGVKIGETEMRVLAQQTGEITVDNNIIHGGGRIHAGAIGVWIGQSADNKVTHNDIGDFFYTGVSVGWRWGYAESLSKRNTIDFNSLHHIGQGVLGDMGGVYTLGPSEGTTVSNNRIHDVRGFFNGSWGLYTDEGSTGIAMENNLVYDCDGGFHQHYGRDNVIRNNIFAFNRETQAQRSRVEDFNALFFQRNILLWDGATYDSEKAQFRGPSLSGNWKDNVTLGDNIYWDLSRRATFNNGETWAQWRENTGDNSLIADPNFVDAAQRDFRLKENSPASKIGFVLFDPSRAGVYGDAAWRKLAASAPMPKLQVPPAPPPPEPLTFKEDFEVLPIGAPPAEAMLGLEGKGESIGVAEDAAANGKRSLKVVDVAGLLRSFNPHFFFAPHHRAGVSRCAFDLRAEAATNFYHEWRDTSQSYKVGPSFRILDGKLIVGGATLLDVPMNVFVLYEITAKVGAKADGTWNLKVTLPDGAIRNFDGLKTVSADWKNLEWLGFVSEADAATTYYLDNLQLENTP